MKKMLVGLLVVMLISTALFAGCASTASESESVVSEESANEEIVEVSEEQQNLIFVSPYYATGYWNLLQQGFALRGEELGYDVQIVGTEAADINELQGLMEAAIASEVNGIGTAGFGDDGLTPNIEQAHEQGIPVVFADCDSTVTGRDGYVGTNNVQMGEAVANALVEALNGTGKVVYFSSLEHLPHIALRKEGILNVLNAEEGIEIIHIEDAEGLVDVTMEKTEAVLNMYDQIDGFICQDGLGIPGIVAILEEKGYEPGDIIVCGTDQEEATLEAVKDGWAYATVVQNPYAMGYYAAEQLDKLINGEEIEDIFNTSVQTLTIDNIDSYNPTSLD